MDTMISLAYLSYLVLLIALFIYLVLLLARTTFSCRIRGTKAWRFKPFEPLESFEPFEWLETFEYIERFWSFESFESYAVARKHLQPRSPNDWIVRMIRTIGMNRMVWINRIIQIIQMRRMHTYKNEHTANNYIQIIYLYMMKYITYSMYIKNIFIYLRFNLIYIYIYI